MIAQPEELFSTATGVPRDVAYFKKERDIDVLAGTEAISIDREKKELVVSSLGSADERELAAYEGRIYLLA